MSQERDSERRDRLRAELVEWVTLHCRPSEKDLDRFCDLLDEFAEEHFEFGSNVAMPI